MLKKFFTNIMSSKMSLIRTSKPLVTFFFWVVIVLCVTYFLIRLSLRPKIPVYKVTNAYAPALDRWNSTFHRNEVPKNNSISLEFEILNANKRIGVYYDEIHITLRSGYSLIGAKYLPGFYQGYRNSTAAEVLVDADQKTWRGIRAKHMNLTVRLQTAVQYKIFRSKTRHHLMDFEACVPIGSNGRILGEENVKLHPRVYQ